MKKRSTPTILKKLLSAIEYTAYCIIVNIVKTMNSVPPMLRPAMIIFVGLSIRCFNPVSNESFVPLKGFRELIGSASDRSFKTK